MGVIHALYFMRVLMPAAIVALVARRWEVDVRHKPELFTSSTITRGSCSNQVDPAAGGSSSPSPPACTCALVWPKAPLSSVRNCPRPQGATEQTP